MPNDTDRHSLEPNEGWFRALLEATPDGTLVVDPLGKIVFVNGHLVTMFGHQRAEDLVGQSMEILVPTAQGAKHRQQRNGYEHAPRPRPMGSDLDLRGRRRDGSEFAIDVSLSPAETPGGRLTIATVRDVSERRALEAEMERRTRELTRANAHLQATDRIKTEFLSALSHELRTPLSSVIGYSEFLADAIAGFLNPRQQEFVAQIQRGGARLCQLIDEMMDFARLELGTITLTRKRIDLVSVVQGVLDAMAKEIEAAGLSLTIATPGEPVIVSLDARSIDQVVVNLIGNALKFTPPGGHVAVRITADDREACVEVQDDGVGVPEDHLSRIFDRFHQADASSTREHGGVGLGLTISRSLVEAHGGSIAVGSSPGLGSTFRFTLPR